MRHRLCNRTAAILLALGVGLAGGPALAQQDDQQQSDPEALAREGAQKLMQALEGLLQVIPQYGMPRIEENGDIVIPRLDKPGTPENDGKDKPKDQDDDGGVTETNA